MSRKPPHAAPAPISVTDGYEAPAHRSLLASTPGFFIPPPFGWSHPITGKRGWQPSFALIAFGMYVKRARYLVNMTQVRLAELSAVNQGQVSRLERGLTPGTRVEDLVSIGSVWGWQPAPAPPAARDWKAEWRAAEQRLDREAAGDDAS